MQNLGDGDHTAAPPADLEKGLPSPVSSSGSTLASSAPLFNPNDGKDKVTARMLYDR